MATLEDRPNPGEYMPRERLLRTLRHQKVDRLPIVPVGLSPFTWHLEFPDYHPILEVARQHCEFMVNFPLNRGIALCDPKRLDMTRTVEEEGERKTESTVLNTPKGKLTQVRIHDRSVGSWGRLKAFVESEEDLEKRESLPFEPVRPDLSARKQLEERIGQAGLTYCNGISNALLLATWGMGEEFRPVFCMLEKERLREMVQQAQERLYDYVSFLLESGAGPVFRWYAIEPFVEPVMPPSFIDEFVVPYDREIVKLIHDRGRYVVLHCHGRLAAQIEKVVKIGFDGVDCVESPPQNDINLAGMTAKAQGKMFIWGYIQFEDLARKTGDQIEAMVH